MRMIDGKLYSDNQQLMFPPSPWEIRQEKHGYGHDACKSFEVFFCVYKDGKFQIKFLNKESAQAYVRSFTDPQ